MASVTVTANACAQCGKQGTGLKRCARCHIPYYCGRDCQVKAWKSHKKACKVAAANADKLAEAVMTADTIEERNDIFRAAVEPAGSGAMSFGAGAGAGAVSGGVTVTEVLEEVPMSDLAKEALEAVETMAKEATDAHGESEMSAAARARAHKAVYVRECAQCHKDTPMDAHPPVAHLCSRCRHAMEGVFCSASCFTTARGEGGHHSAARCAELRTAFEAARAALPAAGARLQAQLKARVSAAAVAHAAAELTELVRIVGAAPMESLTCTMVGDSERQQGRLESALENYARAVVIEETIARSGAERLEHNAACIGGMGNVLTQLGDSAGALSYMLRRLRLAQDSADRKGEGIAASNMAAFFAQSGMNEQAAALTEYGLAVSEKYLAELDDGDEFTKASARAQVCSNLANLCVLHAKLGNLETSRTFGHRALHLGKSAGAKDALGMQRMLQSTLAHIEETLKPPSDSGAGKTDA